MFSCFMFNDPFTHEIASREGKQEMSTADYVT